MVVEQEGRNIREGQVKGAARTSHQCGPSGRKLQFNTGNWFGDTEGLDGIRISWGKWLTTAICVLPLVEFRLAGNVLAQEKLMVMPT